jgi:hypothetical protein
MGEEFSATRLRDRALQFLREGNDVDAEQWLTECPILTGDGRQIGDRVEISLVFGCSRQNMQAFEDAQEMDGPLAEQIYSAFRAVTSPRRVSYSIALQYLPPDELTDVQDDLVFQLEAKSSENDDIPF